MSPLREPPRRLARFPRQLLRPDRPLYRIHLFKLTVWWFFSDGSGRFDLKPPLGTRHLAVKPIGAFLETFRGISVIAEQDVVSRRMSTVYVPDPVMLADCTSARAAGFGVTAALHAGEDYDLTQRWASAFCRAGFEEVRYLLSHDPSQSLAGAALFSQAGAARWPVARTEEVDEELVLEARRRFGIFVVPAL